MTEPSKRLGQSNLTEIQFQLLSIVQNGVTQHTEIYKLNKAINTTGPNLVRKGYMKRKATKLSEFGKVREYEYAMTAEGKSQVLAALFKKL